MSRTPSNPLLAPSPRHLRRVFMLLATFAVGALGWVLLDEPRAVDAAEPPAGVAEHASDVVDLFEDDFVSAWQAADAEALAALWQQDGTWMSMTGSRRVQIGRTAIAEAWSVGLQGRDDPSSRRLAVEIQNVDRAAADVAVVDLVMEFGSEETGTLREAMLAVVVRDDAGTWRIASSRVARL